MQLEAALDLAVRIDEFSVQLTNRTDPRVFIRIASEGDGEFAITDLNHPDWSLEKEAMAIEFAIRHCGIRIPARLWFEKPKGVRGLSTLGTEDEAQHLIEILQLFAQRWTAFIDGAPWSEPRRLGVNFLP